MDDATQDAVVESFNEAVREKAIGPKATTKTLDKDAAQGSSADDAEAAELNARIQANAHMKFSARTTRGQFRTPRSKGK